MSKSPHDILFEPVRIGPVTAPNRFYAVPHATGHGHLQPAGAIALRAMKAEGGWGTVAVQMTEIAPDSDMANHPMERIWDDTDIARHARQADAIKAHGSLAAIELAHGGMRARNITTGRTVQGPSGLPILRPEVPIQARSMSRTDIRSFRQSHRAAAQRAKKAGYDILYVYAAHDLSVLSHFLSVNTNHRTDEYGGSLENRIRLLREVLQDTLDVAGGECAVALRFSVAEPGRRNGMTHDAEGRDVVSALAELPDLWDVNISGWPQDSATARFSPEGFQLPYTDFVKDLTTKPVVGVGRFTSPDLMANLVSRKRLDLIGAARPSIADPFLPTKIRNGELDSIRECIGCNICVSMDGYGVPIRCTQNPTISEEWRRDWHPEVVPAITPVRTHLIVGAGPAGLECATTLVKAGQRVVIADAAGQPGGRLVRESTLPGLNTWIRVRDYRTTLINQSANAQMYLSSSLTADDVIGFGADTVTIATGASWRSDGVGSTQSSAIDFANTRVLTPDDVMSGAVSAGAQSIVVYDDDHFYMGSAIAEQLAGNGHQVIYVTPLPTIATWTDFTLEQERIIERLISLGVRLMPNVSLSNGPTFHDALRAAKTGIDTQAVVLVGARSANDSLHTELIDRIEPNALFAAGDCVAPGIIQAAVLSGHTIAQHILTGTDVTADLKREQIAV